jgi:hypothetical protein
MRKVVSTLSIAFSLVSIISPCFPGQTAAKPRLRLFPLELKIAVGDTYLVPSNIDTVRVRLGLTEENLRKEYLEICRVLDIQPFAFDSVSSPCGELKDNYSYYSVDHWGGVKLRDFCDGYVVPCFFEQAERVSTIPGWIPSEDVWEKIKAMQLSPSVAAQVGSLSDFVKSREELPSRAIKSIHNVENKGYGPR